jgi:hypothetical protein
MPDVPKSPKERSKDAEDLTQARASLKPKWLERNFHCLQNEIEPLKKLLALLAVPGGPRETRRVEEAGDPEAGYRIGAIHAVLEYAETYATANRGDDPLPEIPARRKRRPSNRPVEPTSDLSEKGESESTSDQSETVPSPNPETTGNHPTSAFPQTSDTPPEPRPKPVKSPQADTNARQLGLFDE